MSEPTISVGSRVVRGPDWQWGDQDGGVGHVGTVVTIGRLQHVQCPPGTVQVMWDHGVSQNYRVGYGGHYDLRLLDNGTSGAHHSGQECSQCQISPIYGIIWSSSVNQGIHLCSRCYMSNAHDPHHTFIRHVMDGDQGVPVGERAKEKLVDTFGTYPGAVVARGPDWRFQNQDGGPGSRGVVRDIHDWSGAGGQTTARSVVSVVWSHKEDNMYCRGHKGQMHVVYTTPARGQRVYMSHLPILGFKYETISRKFQIGQHVMVNVDIDTLKQMQIGNGGFNAAMLEVVGKKGKVHRITEKGLIRVQYPGHPPQNHRWALNPASLRVVDGYNVGDQVKISSDRNRVSKYHNTSALESVLGCRGTITLIHSDTSYVVDFGDGKVSTLHPGCIELPKDHEDKQTVNNNCLKAAARGNQVEVEAYLTGSYTSSEFVIIPDNPTLITCLNHAACKGHVNIVTVILKYRSGLVNERHEDKTPLQIASHEGHTIVVDQLMQFGANPSLGDKSGDTALHYAAIGSKSEPILALVNKGADVNYQNNDKRTALHIAVLNRNLDIVGTLVKVGADVNIPDASGDTPFQIAVIQGDHNIVDMLIKDASLLACNGRGHNVLHIASVKGDAVAVEKILAQDRKMINIVTRDGQSALHLGHQYPGVIKSLISCPQCDINIANAQARTVLHIASAKLDTNLVKMLVDAGASVKCQDMLGNTPAHVVLTEGVSVSPGDSLYTNTMESILDKETAKLVSGLPISQVEQVQICLLLFLFRQGAQDIVNYYGQTVVSLIDNADVKKFFQEMVLRRVGDQKNDDHEYAEIVDEAEEATEILDEEASSPGAEGGHPNTNGNITKVIETECMICSEPNHLVTFIPCNCQIVCQDCGSRMKKCLQCGQAILEKRINHMEDSNKLLPKNKTGDDSWKIKYEELKEQTYCTICMENEKNVVLAPCGHMTCHKCSETLSICHMCRETITSKTNVFY